jgi:dTDP-4-dehydrorhamnose 3,5-epimerase
MTNVNDFSYQQLMGLLEKLILQLQQEQLWQTEAPAPEALMSTAPFACDTLTFNQWLQFVFLPNFQQHLQQKKALPKGMALAPMAEFTLPGDSGVRDILIQLDEVVASHE